MLGLAIKGLLGLVLLASGWFAGSIYPAPGEWTAFVKGRASPALALLDLTPDALAQLRQSLSPSDFSRLAGNAAMLAASTGNVIPIERLPAEALAEHADATLERPAPATTFDATLHLCPGMVVNNAPPVDENNRVQNYSNLVSVNGVSVAVNPTGGACLSSGVGPRGGRTHKGLDLHARNGGPVYAAAPGTVVEKLYRDDYGNMLLIDHGAGVYTRYAHLSSFASDISVGAQVSAGEQIGLMGNTAAYPIPVHLHYELLLGDYASRARSFGLAAHSPFEFDAAPAAEAAAIAHRAAPLVPLQLTRNETASRELCPGGPIGAAALITIRRGDTLAAIARACYGDEEAWRQIADCNQFLSERNMGEVSPLSRGHLLYVGDRLSLPAPGARCPAPS